VINGRISKRLQAELDALMANGTAKEQADWYYSHGQRQGGELRARWHMNHGGYFP
jgi:hypothetical protein